MTTISELAAGMSINISVIIVNDNDFNGIVKLKGFYISNLGQNFQTHNINVDYTSGLSECDKSLVEGDTINWINLVSDDIQIFAPYPLWTNSIIAEGSSASKQFVIPGESFSYFFKRNGFTFTPTCTITILDDSGLITNPIYDASLSLDIKVINPETNVTVSVPIENYVISVFTNAEGILSITNSGNKIAKNVKLTADWFSFNSNNFDLEVGQTKGLIYSLSPQIFSTNDTNKSYSKILTVEGNFPTYSHNFTINVPYAVIAGTNSSGGLTGSEWIELFCKQIITDPYGIEFQKAMCVGKTIVIGQNTDGSNISVDYTASEVRSWFDFMFKESDKNEEFQKWVKENYDLQGNLISNISSSSVAISQKVDGIEKKQNNLRESQMILFIFVLALIVVGLFFAYQRLFSKTKRIDAPRGSLLEGYQ